MRQATPALGLTAALYFQDQRKVAAEADPKMLVLRAKYALSKRTALHASFAHIRNRNGAPYTAGTASEAGKGNRAITFGLRHAF